MVKTSSDAERARGLRERLFAAAKWESLSGRFSRGVASFWGTSPRRRRSRPRSGWWYQNDDRTRRANTYSIRDSLNAIATA